MDNNTIYPHDYGYISVYIHWPFCLKKCPYCDFNSYVSKSIVYQDWLRAYFQSIDKQMSFFEGKKIKSIFFGGGTPSLMKPEMVHEIIQYFKNHNLKNNELEIAEITLESNPSTFEISKFKDFKQAGINRLSTGIQSFRDDSLKFLGRNHSKNEAIKALELSNSLFDRTSFDLIIGLPNQSLDMWKEELDFALNFFKEHISIYQLTIEEGTPFFKNNIPEAPEEIGEELYLHTLETLNKKNILQYEISNFALKGSESIHNLNYWKGGEYIGIGPNAHGRLFYKEAWHATVEHKNPKLWLQSAPLNELKSMFSEFEKVDNLSRLQEITMTSLRVDDFINEDIYKKLNKPKIKYLIDNELLEEGHNSIKTTQKGRLCLNYVLNYMFI